MHAARSLYEAFAIDLTSEFEVRAAHAEGESSELHAVRKLCSMAVA
jgi:hypothetical protein